MGLFKFVKHGKASELPTDLPETSSQNSAVNSTQSDCGNLSLTERLIRYIDCPYKLISQGTATAEINKEYTAALRYGAEHGSTAVIVPVTANLVRLLGKDGEMKANIKLIRELRRALLLQINDSAGDIIIESAYYEKIRELSASGINTNEFERGKAQGVAVNGFHSFISNGRTSCEIIIAQIPTIKPWEVFIWLPVGGMKGAPSDNEFVAVSRLWNEMCGAVPAVINYGAVEYFIPRGKPSPKTAMEIAKGHFAMCPDRVLHMTHSHTLGELADTLIKSCVWYLGWK